MKKLVSLLLVLTLVILTLASCGACDEHEDKDGDGICNRCDSYIPVSVFEAFKPDMPDELTLSATQAKSYEVVGEPIIGSSSVGPVSSNDDYMITKKTETKNIPAELNGGTATTTEVSEYRVYRVSDGALLYTEALEEDESFTADTSTVAMTIVLGGYTTSSGYSLWQIPEKYFLVATTSKAGAFTVALYNQSGSQVAIRENIDVAPTDTLFSLAEFFTDGYFAIDGVLYEDKNGVGEVICDYKLLDLESRLQGYSVSRIGDRYYALGSNSGLTSFGRYIVFDDGFNVVSYYDIPTYSGYGIGFWQLGNGNLLIAYSQSKSVRDLLKDETYDYAIGSTVYNREFYIYDVESGERRAIEDLPFSSYSVQTISSLNANYSEEELNIKCEKYTDASIIIGSMIVDGKAVTNINRIFFLSNDGELCAELEGIEGVSAYDTSPYYLPEQGVYVIDLPYGSYLYSKDGERIGALPYSLSDVSYNSKWIISGNTFYDFGLKETFTVESKYTLVKIANDTVYFTREFPKDPNNAESKAYTQFYALQGDTLKEVFRIDAGDLTKSIFFKNTYYYTVTTALVEGAEAVTTYTVYSSAGVALLTLSIQNTATEQKTVSVVAGSEQFVLREAVTTVATASTVYKYHVVK
ncbi:MAG: hypothetical protein J6L90_06180 [Clostridia bacterium]|nr:hypothetical protein [Clostridia bacterium]